MRGNSCRFTISLLALLLTEALPCAAARFGTVVSIGGQASDVALDQTRKVLYIANFTANRIEVMSTDNYGLRAPIVVAPQPVSISMSQDGQYLLVAHFGNFSPPDPTKNLVTLVHLADNTKQTFNTQDPPLGVAFIADGRALIVTTTALVVLDPSSGIISPVSTFANLAKTLPVDKNTFPLQVTAAQLASNPNATVIYGVADNGGGGQAYFNFNASQGIVTAVGFVASPKPLPRVTVPADGSWAMVGQYKLTPFGLVLGQFPNAIQAVNIGGSAVDSRTGTIYAQILTVPQPNNPVANPPSSPAAAPSAQPPVLSIMDADNLTVRESLALPENLVGKAVLSSAGDVLYAVSDSGVTVLPVGNLNQFHQLFAAQEDVLIQTNFCDRGVLTQTLTITDPGGGHTDFQISTTSSGVTFSPSSGVTPATVTIQVNSNIVQNLTGTLAIPLTLTSSSAVNLPPPVRLLVNNHSPEERGTMVNVPGTLTDLLADPVRNRFYLVRQDRNLIEVFDGANYTLITTLRTATTPTQMAFSFDRKYLVVAHDNAQLVTLYDLDALQPVGPIFFPSGHYPESIAESAGKMLAVVRNAAAGPAGVIDSIDIAARTATQLPSLGVFKNDVNPLAVLSPSPSGGFILVAMPDGNVMLYDAGVDTFTISRKDNIALQGPYAASDFNSYVVGGNILDSSLVQVGTLDTSAGPPSAFAFVNQSGFSTTASTASSAGVIQRFNPSQNGIPTSIVEAPLLPGKTQPFIRTLAPLYDTSAVIALTVSGFTAVPWNYDAPVVPPQIGQVVSGADFTLPVAQGGLITVFGSQLSQATQASQNVPLPTTLGEACLEVNGVPVPLMFVSSGQFNGQIPFSVSGNSKMTLRTPGGVSNTFNFMVTPVAPSVFLTTSPWGATVPTVVRADNNQLVTPSNPIHDGSQITIYATGLGATSPPVAEGLPGPSDPLALVNSMPRVTLGGVNLTVTYAGLVPWGVGVYQINAATPLNLPQGMEIPLVISQGTASTTLTVRVVK